MRMITEKEYKTSVGLPPYDDAMERVNCEKAGKPGHYFCGWCEIHNKPRFHCLCRGVES